MPLSFYPTYEYMLTISPHEALWDKIIQIKQAFAKKYNCATVFSTMPQLALLRFVHTSVAEERITQRMRTVAMTQAPIKIELSNFGAQPSHSIYINVTTKIPVLQLTKALKEIQPLLKFSRETKPYFLTEPQITIARKLQPWQYEKAWKEYSNSLFSGRFIAHKMTLIKRKVGNLSYQHVADFDFQQLPVLGQQGSLFA